MALNGRETATLRRRVLDTIHRHGLCAPGDTLIVAVSGGADSVVLLDLLAGLPDFSLSLVVAHLNHCLRGAESDGDEQFVAELAAVRDLPFETCRVDVRALAAEQGLSPEEAGREARYTFFGKLRRKYGAAAVATAHHGDDQAETFLLRLLRGAGGTGLGCMPFRNGRGVIRPLLEMSRHDLHRYLRERGLSWREDSSNRDTTLLRNRVRHELLPLLETYNPEMRRRLAATADLLTEENRLLERMAAEAFARICRQNSDGWACDIGALLREPRGLRRRLLRLVLARLAGGPVQVSSRHIEALEQMLASPRPNARLALPRRITALREYGTLLLFHAPAGQAATPDLVIGGPGRYPLPGGGWLTVSTATFPETGSIVPEFHALFDPAAAPFPWLVRTFRPGDRIRLPGMTGRKKLKDLFIDDKIPRSRRQRLPLLFSGDGELLWIVGLRRSCAALPGAASSHTLQAVVESGSMDDHPAPPEDHYP